MPSRSFIAALLCLLAVVAAAGGARAGDPSRSPLPAPNITLTSAQIALYQPLPLYNDTVPVLAYHSIGNTVNDGYTLSQQEFATEMAMLHQAGFHTLSAQQYYDFLHGHTNDLPSRPILITFDDGKLGSYQGADQVLARYGFRAIMFVIAGDVGHTTYLNWDELRAMQASGRWDLQEHAGYGHVLVTYAEGKTGPYYAYRKLLSNGQLESYADFQARVTADLSWGADQLKAQVPGFTSYFFAVPYSNYGQDGTNDQRIPSFMLSLLEKTFDAVFVDDHAVWSHPDQDHSLIQRFGIHSTMTADRLYLWLRGLQPKASGQPPSSIAPTSLDLNLAAPAPAKVGRTISYTLTVSNGGAQAASLVELRAQLPATVGVVRAGQPGVCSLVDHQLTCQFGTINPGASSSLTVVLRPSRSGLLKLSFSLSDSYRLSIGSTESVGATTRILRRR